MLLSAANSIIGQEISSQLAAKPFCPHPLFRQPHLMTLAGHFLPRPHQPPTAENRLFDIEPGVQILAHCDWQPQRDQAPTLVVAHGLEGSTLNHYMIGTAIKAHQAGFNVVRVNQRGGCQTHHLATKPYHVGLTDDLRTILAELINIDKLPEIYLLGYSMGGNQALKLAAEYGTQFPQALRGICAVSAPIDLSMVTAHLHHPSNRLFEWNFLRVLHRSLIRYQRSHPTRFDLRQQWRAYTIRRFDELFTAPYGGFRNLDEYYQHASSALLLPKIQLPTLVIQAQDDPFIPFKMFETARYSATTTLLAPAAGGHLGFLNVDIKDDPDRYWVENRAVEFFQLLHQKCPSAPTLDT
jgi:predicted alpha/beta-fold hydrolase